MKRTLVLSLCLMNTLASAATIRVAQDGTGDFLTLFDAEAAASPGDTLRIGPGEWSDLYEWTPVGFNRSPVILGVTTDSLTIIGESREGVVLSGPGALEGFNFGIAVHPDVTHVAIADLTVTGVREGVVTLAEFTLVERVTTVECEVGLAMNGSRALVRRVDFRRNVRDAIKVRRIGAAPHGGVEIRECSFEGSGLGLDTGIHDYLSTTVRVFGSTFFDLGGGIVATGTVEVADVTFDRVRLPFTVRSGGSLDAEGILARASDFGGVYCSDDSEATIRRSRFVGVQSPMLKIEGSCRMSVTESDLLPLDGGDFAHVTSVPDDSLRIFDFENNYWGTSDPDEIGRRIQDGRDPRPYPWIPVYAVVDFEPFQLTPVSNETTSFGGLKGRLRRGN